METALVLQANGSKAHAEQKWSHLHIQDTSKNLLNLKPELCLTISCHKNSTDFDLFCFYPPNPTVRSPKSKVWHFQQNDEKRP